MTTRTIIALAVIGALAGCATNATQEDFGSSVNSLVQAQTANPATLTSPSTAIVTGVDGDYANRVIEEFRKDVAKPQEVRDPIEMVLWGSGGR